MLQKRRLVESAFVALDALEFDELFDDALDGLPLEIEERGIANHLPCLSLGPIIDKELSGPGDRTIAVAKIERIGKQIAKDIVHQTADLERARFVVEFFIFGEIQHTGGEELEATGTKFIQP